MIPFSRIKARLSYGLTAATARTYQIADIVTSDYTKVIEHYILADDTGNIKADLSTFSLKCYIALIQNTAVAGSGDDCTVTWKDHTSGDVCGGSLLAGDSFVATNVKRSTPIIAAGFTFTAAAATTPTLHIVAIGD
jgi:hypothetical protein